MNGKPGSARLLASAVVLVAGIALVGGPFTGGRCNARAAPPVRVGEIEIVLDPAPNVPSETRKEPSWTSHDSRFLEELFRKRRWVAYAPTNFDPTRGIVPSEASLRKDLAVLRDAGFDALVTYGAGLTSLPRLAREAGFRAMLQGVWDPASATELSQAREAAKERIVIGLVVGNEGLTFGRYDFDTLRAAMVDLAATGKPVGTTEVLERYQTEPRLLEIGAFLAPNVHPYFHQITEPRQAAAWTLKAAEDLARRTDRPILLKEVGLPSDGDPRVSEQAQAEYYRLLQRRRVPFVWFEAFDGPWKRWAPVEPHWGLFRADRSPKPVVRVLPHQLWRPGPANPVRRAG